ncbi:MAG TPA: type VI secretion system tip protein TssI/VgrG [Polyangia bacterium]|jgi:type VI secretion system secreted protein VgrG|nr:type VI secretion system tip protein TssI/VgrG [Polyangia bacterium]
MLPTDRTPITIEGAPIPLLLRRMSGSEELGRLFHYDLELLSELPDVPSSQLLGKPLTVCLSKAGGVRFFNGIVTHLRRLGRVDKYTVLQATLSPRLWLLQKTMDCRVYQDMTVPDVVQSVFREHSITFESKLLDDSYPTWDYLTQYRESDFAFISRLMEREGIYYYFTHTQGEHKLVLADSISSHKAVGGYETLPVRPSGSAQFQRDHLTEWHHAHETASTAVTLEAHDFRLRQGADIKGAKTQTATEKEDLLEIYDYAGHHAGAQDDETGDAKDTREAGEHYAQMALQGQQAEADRIEGDGNARGLEAGALFQIEDLTTLTDQLLLVRTQLALSNPALESGGGAGNDEICHVSFTAIAGKRPFRSQPLAAPPFAGGPETATVVGPSDEEIWTDKYGRVRVQFHWDRKGQLDEDSTCWIRVGQMWAGANWGSLYIPRIGQEVIVQFLGGNPDRPIITGSVYNANNMPPYTLPDNKTQSGIKSRSTKGAAPSNFNEIRFEDKKGAEELFFQAEKNQTTKVKHDQSISVGADRSVSVGGNESISVTGTRTSTITKKEKQTFVAEREMTVGKTDTVTVTDKHTGTYQGGREQTVEQGDVLTVQASDKTTTVHGQYNVTADAQFQVVQGPNKLLIKDAVDLDSQGPITVHNPKCSVELKDGKITVTAAEEMVLQCGSASISLKKDGTIEINGAQKVHATGGGSGVELVQAGATVSGTKTTMSGTALAEITGAIVKIN